MQLRGGIVPEAGTVEYCIDGTWQAVCDSSWDYIDSFVVCRQLGFPATGNHDKYMQANILYFQCHSFITAADTIVICTNLKTVAAYRCSSISKFILWGPSLSI